MRLRQLEVGEIIYLDRGPELPGKWQGTVTEDGGDRYVVDWVLTHNIEQRTRTAPTKEKLWIWYSQGKLSIAKTPSREVRSHFEEGLFQI